LVEHDVELEYLVSVRDGGGEVVVGVDCEVREPLDSGAAV
jgi:hypothetical protein